VRHAVLGAIIVCILVGLVGCSGSTGLDEQSPPGPAARISIESVRAEPGQLISVGVSFELLDHPSRLGDSLRAMELVFTYDTSVLTYRTASIGAGISEWETVITSPMRIRASAPNLWGIPILAFRDSDNNTTPNPSQYVPEGELLSVQFQVNSDTQLIGHSSPLNFYSPGWRANTLRPENSRDTFLIQFHDQSDPTFVPLWDTLNTPRRYHLLPVIEFVNGSVKIDASTSLSALGRGHDLFDLRSGFRRRLPE
jgi:hypothetical protein